MALALLLGWLAVIAICLNYGRSLAPFIEGPALPWVAVGMPALGLAALGLALRRLRKLPAPRRPAAWAALGAASAALALLAWAQPMFIERTHLVLYGVLGLLAYNFTRGRSAPGKALAWALAITTLTGAADEYLQHLHPQRFGTVFDAVTNILSSAVLILTVWALDRLGVDVLITGGRKGSGPRSPC